MAEKIYILIAPWILPICETLMIIGAAALTLRKHRNWQRTAQERGTFFDRVERFFGRIARQRTLAIMVVGGLALSARIALTPILPIPLPEWNDEFSYLLAANTFTSGRLTNPTHPMWVHFEGFQIIQHPSYMSMYTPGQGLVLALGKIFFGHPWAGVLLITATVCAAICWMLQGWMPPTWAFFGGILAVLRLGIFSYWMNSYWCPALAATGGALVIGSLPRLRNRASPIHVLALASGLAIMANSRPYEGLVLTLALATAVPVWLKGRKHLSAAIFARRVVVPACLLLAMVAGVTGYYYWRVTGSPLRMTYQVNRQTYAVVPYFLCFNLRPVPHYEHQVMRDYYAGWEVQQFMEGKSLTGFLRRSLHKIFDLWRFYVGPALTLPLLALPFVFRDRKMRLTFIAGGVFCLGFLIETWTFPHYVAPATGLVYIVIVQCLRHVWLWRRNDAPTGKFLVRIVPLTCIAMMFFRLTGLAVHAHLEPRWPRGNLDRPKVIAQLLQIPGKHLVIVRYGPDHNVDRDWIYNDPDIDRSQIAWARDMGDSRNLEVLHYFNDRHAWLMNGDDFPPKLTPYNEPNDPPISAAPQH